MSNYFELNVLLLSIKYHNVTVILFSVAGD